MSGTPFNQAPQSSPGQVPPTPPGSPGIKPNKSKSNIGHVLLKPIKWGAKSLAWLATPTKSGGAQYVMYALCFGTYMLSVENFYVAMHKENPAGHRFIYKLGLTEDGADLVRLIPLPGVLDGIQNAVLGISNWAIKGVNPDAQPLKDTYNPKLDLIVWGDPKFYAAIVGAFVLSALQAVALRRVSLEVRKRQLEEAKKLDGSIEKAIEGMSKYEQRKVERLETKVRKAQVKSYGNGSILLLGSLVLGSYFLEGAMFFASAKPGTPFFQSMILAIGSMFGPECSFAIAKDFESREDGE